MGRLIQIGAVKAWYDEQGSGDPLVLLHGGLCTNDMWGAQLPALAAHFRCFLPERSGHGHTADLDGAWSYDEMANETIAFLEDVVKEPAYLVGHSDGGIIGLLVASLRPDLVRKLVAISANLNPQGAVPEAIGVMTSITPDSEMFAPLRMMYDAATPEGPEHWATVFAKGMTMASTQPDIKPQDLAKITAPTLVMAGDDDFITHEHTASIFEAIPNADLAIVPHTTHFLIGEKPDLVNSLIIDFLSNEPGPTAMPFRRAHAPA